MSPQFSELDRWAKAAQAAYARFDLRPNEIDALTEKDTGAFVNGEASRFAGLPPRDPFGPVAQGFQFLDHQPDELSGFSATTFLDRTSGKYVLAIRGTAGLADYAEDLNRIGIQGFAGDQMVSLYRYYKRLTTPAGQSVSYNDAEISILQSIKTGVPISPASAIFSAATTAALRAQLALDRGEQGLTGSGSSVLPAGAPLIVTGHSLGGHLALLFGRFFPEVTEHVYTYNAPGISAVGEFALRAMGVPPSPPSLVTNVASELGGEAISRIWSKPGDIVGIATEPGSLLHQHSIVPLADTLALYGAFEMLSPDSPPDAAAVTGIIQAASPLPYDGIEVLVDELGQLLGTDIASTPIAYTSADRDARDAYFRNLFAVLDGREPGRDYQIISLVGKSAAELEKLAASEIGVRYALSSLQAFAAKNADYSGFADSHSGEWLASRAEWLEAELRGNVADQPFAVGADGKSILFRDLDIGRTYAKFAESQVAQFPQSPGVSDVEWLDGLMASATYDGIVTFGLSDTPNQLSGRLGDDRLFGGDAADTLVGDAGDDYLEGGAGDDRLLGDAGDDTLVGGAGADRLEGGAGADAYVYAESLDGDTIFDTDGRIFVAGAPLVGGRGSAGSYASTDGQYTYGFTGDLLLGGTLTINGTLRVENFHNGDLGIRLGITGEPDDAAPPGPAGGILLLGDYDYRGYTDELTHTQYFGFDEYGNPNADAIATSHPDRVDTYENFEGFPGTPGATHFIAGGGDDIMQDILGGDDWLELGTGDDAGWGGAGDDTVEGGPGRDIVAGGRGNDALYAGAQATKAADLDDEAVGTSPDTGGLLSGGDGNDFIYGDAGENLIEGGAGDDQIYAGAGDDWIGADVSVLAATERYRIFPPNNDWVNREVDILWNPYLDLPAYALGGSAPFGTPRQASIDGRPINVVTSTADGRDYIDAGAGNDTIFAGGGDDVILAGSGDDYIDPGYGSDWIDAGDGGDYIVQRMGDTRGDYIDAGAGDDVVIDLVAAANRIDGGPGNDRIESGAGDDVLLGGDGDDVILSSGGNDIALGGDGNDTIRLAGDGDRYLGGGAGTDRLVGVNVLIVGNALPPTVPGAPPGSGSPPPAGADPSAGSGGYLKVPFGGAATFLWGPGDGNDTALVFGGSGILQIGGAIRPGDVTIRSVSGVGTGEFLIPGEPEASGSGFVLSTGDESFTLLELPQIFGSADLSVRFADGMTWDDAYLRLLAAPLGAPADPVALAGTSTDDVVYGSGGNDRFVSSTGDDWLIGGAGDDLYEYVLGGGFDEIEDSDGGADTLRFGTGIATADVGVYAAGSDYIFAVGDGGVRIRGGRTTQGAIETVDFADGTRWTPADAAGRAELLPDNRAPAMQASLGRVAVEPGDWLQVRLPEDTATDPDRFDSVGLYAVTADGERLPGWLNFDAATRTLAGTPAEGDAGVHEILFIAADTSGAAAAARFTIAVGPDLPELVASPALGGGARSADDTVAPTIVEQLSADQAQVGAEPATAALLVAANASPSRNADEPLVPEFSGRERAEPPLALADSADPAFRAVQHQLDMLLQSGRSNLGERYAEAIREFEERRLEREEAPAPPPAEEEIEAWNAAMHSWHDRNPGFSETEPGTSDGAWSMGWGLPGTQQGALGEAFSGAATPGLAGSNVFARLRGAASEPALNEGLSQPRP